MAKFTVDPGLLVSPVFCHSSSMLASDPGITPPEAIHRDNSVIRT